MSDFMNAIDYADEATPAYVAGAALDRAARARDDARAEADRLAAELGRLAKERDDLADELNRLKAARRPEAEVLRVGTPVTIGDDIAATITAVSLRGSAHRVTYEATYWDGRSRKQEWLDPAELEPGVEALRAGIGFGVSASK